MESLKEKAASPFILILVGVILVGLITFFAFIKPKLDADQAMRAFNSPAGQARRDPDQRTTSPTVQAKLNDFLAKDQGAQQHRTNRRRRD